MRYLVDTDWAIDHMRRRARVVELLEEFAPYGLGLSIVSVAELYEGVFNSTDRQSEEYALRAFLTVVEIVPLDEAICRIFARERSRLRAAGNLIGDLDILIGSTALRHNLTLLTNNRRDFERLQDLSIVSV